jgi:hypothetical protein
MCLVFSFFRPDAPQSDKIRPDTRLGAPDKTAFFVDSAENPLKPLQSRQKRCMI